MDERGDGTEKMKCEVHAGHAQYKAFRAGNEEQKKKNNKSMRNKIRVWRRKCGIDGVNGSLNDLPGIIHGIAQTKDTVRITATTMFL